MKRRWRGEHWPEYAAEREHGEERYCLLDLYLRFPDTLEPRGRPLYCTEEQAAALLRFLDRLPPVRCWGRKRGWDR